ncbi:MAG: DUF2974 domain-containing protein [Clostridia bacterium]|nr:DUF2974 domain-containing protein [Clostridia bacterium]
MANILDYLVWRGDLSFKNAPFNEVDNLILTQLAFMNFDEIMENDRVLPLREVEKRFFQKYDKATFRLGIYFPAGMAELLSLCAKSCRFGDVLVTMPINLIDRDKKIQFGAMTFLLPDRTVYCAYRGTDDRLLSWYESLSLGVYDELPIHTLAKEYFDTVMKTYRFRKCYVGGHSKGGHLAMYAAMKANPRAQKRIRKIYNNDGPGFRYDVSGDPAFLNIQAKIVRVTPSMSIVGAMLKHHTDEEILSSDGEGVFQHDAFNWHVSGTAFVRLDKRTEESYRLEKSVNAWLGKMSDTDKERFLDAMYTLLTASGAETLSEISEDKLGSAYQFGKTLLSFDKETREVVSRAVMVLLKERRLILKKEKEVSKQMKKQKKTSDEESVSSSDEGTV